MIQKLGLAAALLLCLQTGAAMAADQRHPVMEGYGAIVPLPTAKERPDRSLRYRVVFSVTKAAAAPDQVDPSLEKVARFLNLLGADGVRPAPGDVVVVVHGPATSIVMADARYAARSQGAHNPNLPLIAALRSAGVSVRVCSQALAANRFDPAEVSEGVEMDVAALTTLANLQLRGWALIPD